MSISVEENKFTHFTPYFYKDNMAMHAYLYISSGMTGRCYTAIVVEISHVRIMLVTFLV